jgi:hypothetical protein
MDAPTGGMPGSPTPQEVEMSRSRAALLAAVGVVLIGGLVGGVLAAMSRRDAGRAPLKPGWTSRTVSAAGFTIGLPPGWVSVSTTNAVAAYESLGDVNPKLAALVKDQLASSDLVKLLAFDTRAATIDQGFPTSLTIAAAPVAEGMDLDAFVAGDVQQLRAVAGSKVTVDTSRLVVPAGETALVQTELPLGGRTSALNQYLFVRGGFSYVLSFTTLPANRAPYIPLFEEIARTLRFR